MTQKIKPEEQIVGWTGQNSSTGLSGVLAQDEGVPLGTGTTFNFVGAGVQATISGSVVRVAVDASSGGGDSFLTSQVFS